MRKVFISTSSKALQDQIIYKDLAFFAWNLWLDFSYTKLKGKRNYMSIYSFFDYFSQNEVFSMEEVSFFSKIVLWLFDTKEWELDELNFYPQEFQILRKINADNSFVFKDLNPYKPYEFVNKARQKAQNSNIVVINHSLLLNDLVNDNAIFGNISNLIVDEAHNLEDSATDAFKEMVTLKTLEDSFSFIEKVLSKKHIKIERFHEIKDKIILNFTMIFESFFLITMRKNQRNHQKNI